MQNEASSALAGTTLSTPELQELWRKIILGLLPKLSKVNILTWFKNTAILDVREGTMVIGAPNAFVQGTLARKFHTEIFQTAKTYFEAVKRVSVEVDVTLNNSGDPRTFDVKSLLSSSEKRLSSPKAVFSGESNGTHLLNPRYTFESYIVGENNRLAFAASCAVSNNPGGSYNPLFIYGGVGLGKTHLLQGIGNATLKKFPRKKVVYVTSEQFTNELINAITNRKTNNFKDRYRSIDMLIVDDIQFLANKVQTQVEFFHTFNTLYEAGKQIVMSSDRPPRELKTLEDRLASRFGMGMLVDIHSPDVETKLAILQRKCQERGRLIPGELLEYIATHTNGNVRELEGALIHILAHVDLTGDVPTVEILARTLGGTPKTTDTVQQVEVRRRPLDHDDVIRLTAEYFETAPDDIMGPSRKQEIVMPRQVSMFIMRKKLNYSYERIGEIFGGRNHTTVMHSFEKIEQDLKKNKSLIKNVNTLIKDLGL